MKPTQVYSVYDYDTRTYRYFAAPLGHVPAAGHFRTPTTTIAPEGLMMPLPPNAKPIGEGIDPQGIIATRNVPLGEGNLLGALVGLGALAGIGWWLYRKAKRSERSRRER